MKTWFKITLFVSVAFSQTRCGESKIWGLDVPTDPKTNRQVANEDEDPIELPTSLKIEMEGEQVRLSIEHPEELEDDEVYVLESSFDLNQWTPYRIYVNSLTLTVPKRENTEFFRVAIKVLPELNAGGSLHAINYQPEMTVPTGPNGETTTFPEQGTFFIVGGVSLRDPTSLAQFPSIFDFPPQTPSASLAPFEIGIRGLNAGKLVYNQQTSFGFRSPDFSNRAEAEAYLNNLRPFIVPRLVADP